MILKIFTVKDTKVQAFANPFYARSTGEAMRTFENIFSSKDPAHQSSPMLTNPQDFHLYEIGTFDDETGQVSHVDHISLVSGSQFVS